VDLNLVCLPHQLNLMNSKYLILCSQPSDARELAVKFPELIRPVEHPQPNDGADDFY